MALTIPWGFNPQSIIEETIYRSKNIFNKFQFTQDFKIPFRSCAVNIPKAVLVFLFFYAVQQCAEQWKLRMDKTIKSYQEAIRLERSDRREEALPIPSHIRQLCKKSKINKARYDLITEHIEQFLQQDLEEMFTISLDEEIADFEKVLGTEFSAYDSYDILDYYFKILKNLLNEIEYPLGSPYESNKAIVVKALTEISVDSVQITALPIELHQGPSPSIKIGGHLITKNTDISKPIEVINPITGNTITIRLEQYYN